MIFTQIILCMGSEIEINPSICHGKPVVKGTRVMITTVLSALASGDSVEDVLDDYPAISKQDTQAIFEFASKMAAFESHPYDAVA